MLINTMNVVAIRCPSCGRLEFRGLSLFYFAGSHTWQVECSCGALLLSLTKKGKHFMLQYHCLMCDAFHNISCQREQLWSRELFGLSCSASDLEVGFIGPRDKVQKAVQHHEETLAEMAENLGFKDFFEQPEIMYQLIAFIYELSEDDRVTCGCGNKNIEIEIFPGHLQLRCEACGAEISVAAGCFADLEEIKRTQQICLPGHLADKDVTGSGQRWRRRKKSPV